MRFYLTVVTALVILVPSSTVYVLIAIHLLTA